MTLYDLRLILGEQPTFGKIEIGHPFPAAQGHILEAVARKVKEDTK